jgi:hypothetical protein
MKNPMFFRRKKKSHFLRRVIGGALLAAVGAGVVAMFPDLKRYIRISRM